MAVSVTSLANVPKLVKTTAPLAARSATSVVESVTLLGTALKVAAMEVASVAVAMVVASRPATPVVVLAIWPVTALMVRSVTTVSWPL